MSTASTATGVSALVGERLRDVRRRQRVTQQGIADGMLDLGHLWERSVVSRVETGRRRLSLDEFVALCYTLDVDYVTLLPRLPLS